jgi:hypothetical protein
MQQTRRVTGVAALARLARIAGTLALLVPAMGAPLRAQGTPKTFTATVGVKTEIDAGDGQITVSTKPTHGTTDTATDSGAGGKTHLFYTTSATETATSDTLTYKIGTQPEQTARITIAPKAPTTGGDQKSGGGTTPGDRPAQSGFSDDAYKTSFQALFVLFVLATVLESALALLFNWRPFVETFNARAVRPVISFAVSMSFVWWFKLDIVTTLVNAIQQSSIRSDLGGKILTAMVLAGGSAGINNLMVALGFRQVKTPETAVPKPAPTEGWIAVSIIRKAAVGPVSVCIGTPVGGQIPLVATIEESTRSPFYRYFFRDPGRFPGTGGYSVPAGSAIAVEVSAATATPGVTKTVGWGPKIIAAGAIINLQFDV